MVSHECTYVVTVWPYWGIIKFHAYLSFCHTSASTNLCHKWWKMGWNLFWRIILIFIQLHFHEISIHVKECFTNNLLKRKCIRIRPDVYLCNSSIKMGFRQKPILAFSFMFNIDFYKTNVPLWQTNLIVLERSLVISEILSQWEFLQYNSLNLFVVD